MNNSATINQIFSRTIVRSTSCLIFSFYLTPDYLDATLRLLDFTLNDMLKAKPGTISFKFPLDQAGRY
jgi:hypothetical protein